MTYRIKYIHYPLLLNNTTGNSNDRIPILLQNENGPCPLLAAINALLLRGVVTLPHRITSVGGGGGGVATVEDVITVLANRALENSARRDEEEVVMEESEEKKGGESSSTPKSENAEEEKESGSRQILLPSSSFFHVDELMEILPKLQYGLDVNPRFTAGVTGYEYTSGLTAFDLLGVELVHGWLLDPQDEETHRAIGNKSYNELVEDVIKGNEAALELSALEERIREMEEELRVVRCVPSVKKNDGEDDGKSDDIAEEKVADTAEEKSVEIVEEKAADTAEGKVVDTAEEKAALTDDDDEYVDVGNDYSVDAVQSVDSVEENEKETVVEKEEKNEKQEQKQLQEQEQQQQPQPQQQQESKTADTLSQKLSSLKTQLTTLQHSFTRGTTINTFLSETSHQLTYHGVEQLSTHVSENQLCIFFRNNHFSTMLKYEGKLYLLVTDMGYATTQHVVWETLNQIDGDSEYVDGHFLPTKPQATLGAAAPFLSPEQISAQEGQAAADYRLAMRLQNGANGNDDKSLEVEEAALLQAATEASLQEFHGITPPPPAEAMSAANNTSGDHEIAMKLQQQYNVIAANQIDQQERRMQERRPVKQKKGSECVIS